MYTVPSKFEIAPSTQLKKMTIKSLGSSCSATVTNSEGKTTTFTSKSVSSGIKNYIIDSN